MSFFAQRYPLRLAKLLRQRGHAVASCGCSQQRYFAAAAQLECLPGSVGRATTDFKAFVGRFQEGTATAQDAWTLSTTAMAWIAAFMVGTAFGKKSIQGYKLYN